MNGLEGSENPVDILKDNLDIIKGSMEGDLYINAIRAGFKTPYKNYIVLSKYLRLLDSDEFKDVDIHDLTDDKNVKILEDFYEILTKYNLSQIKSEVLNTNFYENELVEDYLRDVLVPEEKINYIAKQNYIYACNVLNLECLRKQDKNFLKTFNNITNTVYFNLPSKSSKLAYPTSVLYISSDIIDYHSIKHIKNIDIYILENNRKLIYYHLFEKSKQTKKYIRDCIINCNSQSIDWNEVIPRNFFETCLGEIGNSYHYIQTYLPDYKTTDVNYTCNHLGESKHLIGLYYNDNEMFDYPHDEHHNANDIRLINKFPSNLSSLLMLKIKARNDFIQSDDFFSNLTSLLWLDLSNSFLNVLPKSINTLNIIFLDLKQNNITTIDLNLPSLIYLNLSHNLITDLNLNTPSLKFLNLSRNLIQSISNLPSLKFLNLSDNRLKNLNDLNLNPNLDYLNLSYNPFSYETLNLNIFNDSRMTIILKTTKILSAFRNQIIKLYPKIKFIFV